MMHCDHEDSSILNEIFAVRTIGYGAKLHFIKCKRYIFDDAKDPIYLYKVSGGEHNCVTYG